MATRSWSQDESDFVQQLPDRQSLVRKGSSDMQVDNRDFVKAISFYIHGFVTLTSTLFKLLYKEPASIFQCKMHEDN
jgi:hypothetical protein